MKEKTIVLRIPYNNLIIPVHRDVNWYINITELEKYFEKKWKFWKKKNKKQIQRYKKISGSKQIIKTKSGKYGGTWISFELAIQVLISWDYKFAFQLCCFYKNYVMNLQDQIIEKKLLLENQINQIEINQLKIIEELKKRDIFEAGPCVYCYRKMYGPSSENKVGSTDLNINEVLLNHRMSVGVPLIVNWICYTPKASFIESIFKGHFEFPETRMINGLEHYLLPAETLKKFFISICSTLGYNYKEVSQLKIKFYNEYSN